MGDTVEDESKSKAGGKGDRLTSASTSFFLPLQGNEQFSRLEQKFENFLGSDEDSDSPPSKVRGKVSQWKIKTSQNGLHSQSSKKKMPVAFGGKEKSKSPREKKRSHLQGNKSKSTANDNQKDLPIRTPIASVKVSPKGIILPASVSQKCTPKKLPVERDYEITKWSGDDGEQDSCSNTKSKDGLKNAESKVDDEDSSYSTKPVSSTALDEDMGTVDSWEGFSLSDTERPKLPLPPVGPKVVYQLSAEGEEPLVMVPAPINQYLRDYQREGIKFLYNHYTKRTGALLGDDMGLGKTVQVIGFLSALLGKQGNKIDTVRSIPKFIRQMSDDMPDTPPRQATKPFLIIGPSAVMFNWLDELNTWGYFISRKFHGADKETCLNELRKGKLEIIVTTFETFRDNVERLNQVEWEAVIVDEVHKIKGLKAHVTQALRIIKTPCRYGLTGTALQNNLTELWSLLDWAQPGILGTLEQFDTQFVQVIENGQRHDATKRELAHARKQKDKFAELRKKMLLRRTKAIIANQLPSKEDLVVMCRLTDLQVSVYKAILTHPDMDLVLKAEDLCDCHSGKLRASCCYKYAQDGTKAWALVFSYMHLLLKAANHTALLIPDKHMKEKQAKLARSVCEIAFQDHPQFVEQTRTAAFRTLSDPKYCGKMKILQGLLSVFSASHDKVLVFSYSTKLLDIIEQYVISEGQEYRRIDGKVNSQRRQTIVQEFNTDSNIFLCLISTKAGGLGLNLTSANRVVIFDPNWNPSHDLQAQDRAYRIGQTRDVKVYRLVSAGTIEENIYLRQIYKQQLDEVALGTGNAKRYFQGVQGSKGNQGELFGVKNMFTLRTGDSCLTMDILKRNEKLERGLAGYDITKYIPPKKEAESQTDSDGSDTEQRIEYDSEADEEEDETFLKKMFGEERSPLKTSVSLRSDQSNSNSVYERQKQCLPDDSAGTSTVQDNNSDSDEEFSFIPKLHKNQRDIDIGHSCKSTDMRVETTSALDTVHKAFKRGEASKLPSTSVDDFLVSDITFSTTTCRTPDTFVHHSKDISSTCSDKPSKRGAIGGISWLFSDSEDDDGELNQTNIGDKEKGIKINGTESNPKRTKKRTKPNPDLDQSNITAKAHSTNKFEKIKCPKSDSDLRPSTSHDKVGKGLRKNGKQLTEPTLEDEMDEKFSTDKKRASRAKKAKFTSVQSVLESNGVLHTHANPKIVGSSKAEDHMTRCAIQAVYELHTNTQAPALQCDPYTQPEDEEDISPKKTKKPRGRSKNVRAQGNKGGLKCVKAGSFKILIGQTPTTIKRQHWAQLCKFKGQDDIQLAESLLTSNEDQRWELLRTFYCQQHPHLKETVAQIFPSSSSDGTSTVAGTNAEDPKSATKQLLKHQPSDTDCKYEPQTSKGKGSSTKKSSSKKDKKMRKTKRPAASVLFNQSTMASQSQDSITAFTPENLDSLSENSSDGFLPVPPASLRKNTPSAKFSLSKPQTRTRLRQKTVSPHKTLPSSHMEHYNVPQTLLGNECTVDEHITVTDTVRADQTLVEPEEDIPSLLVEMGHKASLRRYDGGINKEKFTKPKTSSTCLRNNPNQEEKETIQLASTSKASVSCARDNFSKLKSEKHPKSFVETTKSSSRNFACVLDDIFALSSESKTKETWSDERETITENRDILEYMREGPSTSRNNSTKSKPAAATTLAGDQSDIFDELLSTSTLKDDRVDCFPRVGLKGETNGRKSKVFSKNKRSNNPTNYKKEQVDFVDDLDFHWSNLEKNSAPMDGSESLFS